MCYPYIPTMYKMTILQIVSQHPSCIPPLGSSERRSKPLGNFSSRRSAGDCGSFRRMLVQMPQRTEDPNVDPAECSVAAKPKGRAAHSLTAPSTPMPGDGLPSTVPHAKPCLVAVTAEKVEFLCTSTWPRKYWTVPHYLATNDVGSHDNYPRDVDVVYLGSVELRGEASCAVRGINFS